MAVSGLKRRFIKIVAALLFAGGDELLKSDAEMMHENLLSHGVYSTLVIHPGMWHDYPLYMTEFDAEIFDKIKELIR